MSSSPPPRRVSPPWGPQGGRMLCSHPPAPSRGLPWSSSPSSPPAWLLPGGPSASHPPSRGGRGRGWQWDPPFGIARLWGGGSGTQSAVVFGGGMARRGSVCGCPGARHGPGCRGGGTKAALCRSGRGGGSEAGAAAVEMLGITPARSPSLGGGEKTTARQWWHRRPQTRPQNSPHGGAAGGSWPPPPSFWGGTSENAHFG